MWVTYSGKSAAIAGGDERTGFRVPALEEWLFLWRGSGCSRSVTLGDLAATPLRLHRHSTGFRLLLWCGFTSVSTSVSASTRLRFLLGAILLDHILQRHIDIHA